MVLKPVYRYIKLLIYKKETYKSPKKRWMGYIESNKLSGD
jgi:hypothetical protein